jgi:hypothetical protein
LNLSVTIKTHPRCHIFQQTFMMINTYLSYNVILGRLLIHKINAMINNKYLAIEFSIDKGVATMRGN